MLRDSIWWMIFVVWAGLLFLFHWLSDLRKAIYKHMEQQAGQLLTEKFPIPLFTDKWKDVTARGDIGRMFIGDQL